MSLYCISVKTGLEEKFKENVLPLVNGNNCAFQGFIHILRKRMRLKNGKEYLRPLKKSVKEFANTI